MPFLVAFHQRIDSAGLGVDAGQEAGATLDVIRVLLRQLPIRCFKKDAGWWGVCDGYSSTCNTQTQSFYFQPPVDSMSLTMIAKWNMS